MSSCAPIFNTGIPQLDTVIFCIGPYGIQVWMLLLAFFLALLLFR